MPFEGRPRFNYGTCYSNGILISSQTEDGLVMQDCGETDGERRARLFPSYILKEIIDLNLILLINWPAVGSTRSLIDQLHANLSALSRPAEAA